MGAALIVLKVVFFSKFLNRITHNSRKVKGATDKSRRSRIVTIFSLIFFPRCSRSAKSDWSTKLLFSPQIKTPSKCVTSRPYPASQKRTEQTDRRGGRQKKRDNVIFFASFFFGEKKTVDKHKAMAVRSSSRSGLSGSQEFFRGFYGRNNRHIGCTGKA